MDGIPSSILDETPAMLPPAGQTSNFINPPDIYMISIVSSTIGLALTFVFVGIRLYTKYFLLKKLYWEDYTCVISVAVYCALVSSVCAGVGDGAGRHQWDVTLSQAIRIGYVAYWGEIAFSVSIAFAKISILLQIQRVFAGTKKGIVYQSCAALLWLNGGFYVAGTLAGIFSCTPREAAWNPFIEGTCINKMMLVVISCGINVLSDIAILVIPLVCTWRLILPLRKKLAIGAVFATAIFALGSAILMLVIVIPLLTTSDITYTINAAALCACAEVGGVIICGCLPFVPRFVQALRHRPGESSYAWSSTDQKYPVYSSAYRQYRSGIRPSPTSTAMDEKTGRGASTAPSSDEEAALSSIIQPLPAASQRVPARDFACRLLPVTEHDTTAPLAQLNAPTQLSQPGFRLSQLAMESPMVETLPSVAKTTEAKSWIAAPELDAYNPSNPSSNLFTSRPSTATPLTEVKDTSLQPALPPKRASSLSERASTLTGQRAMQALAGRFWRDVEDVERDPKRNRASARGSGDG